MIVDTGPRMDGTGPNPDCPLKDADKATPVGQTDIEKELTSASGIGGALIPEGGVKSRKMTKVIDALDAVAKSLYALEKNVMRGE